MYLLVQRPNVYGEVERTAIGPFENGGEMKLFARGVRFASNPRSFVIHWMQRPGEFDTVVHPANLYPFTNSEIPEKTQ